MVTESRTLVTPQASRYRAPTSAVLREWTKVLQGCEATTRSMPSQPSSWLDTITVR